MLHIDCTLYTPTTLTRLMTHIIKYMMQRLAKGKTILLGIALALAAGHARAQEATETLALNLGKALEIALAENPTIQVADEEIALKETAYKESWQSLLPQVDISGTWSHTITAPELSLGGQKFKMGMDKANTVSGALSISVPLFAPAVYKAMSLTRTDIELAVEKARASRQDLVNQVTKAYYQLMLAQDSYEVLKQSFAVAEENFHVVNAKYQQGTVSEFDKISAEVQMNSVRPNLIAAENAVTLSMLQLKVLMGITVTDLALRIDDSLTRYESTVYANELDQLDEGLVNNSTMRQMDLNMKLLRKSRQSLYANFMPTLGASYSYQYQTMNNTNWNIFGFDWANSSSVAFSLSIPIYHAGNFTKLKSNRIQMNQLTLNRTDTERKLNMQAQSYRKNMQASSEQVSSNRENVHQAQKAVEIAGKRYEVGKGTVLELNNSQVQLTQAQLTYNQSIYDYLTAKADLDLVLGREPEDPQQ